MTYTLDDAVMGEDNIAALEEHIEQRRLSLSEALGKYAIVSVNPDPQNPYILMADRTQGMDGPVAISELGYASPSPWTAWTRDERVPELYGKIGLRTYYDMKRADGTVRGALRLLKTPILAARWFVEPASDSTIDKNIAEFVEKNLFEELTMPWSRIVEDALLMCEFGFMPFELVFQQKDGKLKLAKLAPRHPMDVNRWEFDEYGGPDGFYMEQTMATGFGDGEIFIPISKAVIFVLEQEAGDLRGTSILRSAYKHYYYKDTLYKIDAIQKERHGIGIPIIKLPPGFSMSDRQLADELGRNLRTNERAHIVIPANWEISFAEISTQPVNCMTSIEHHDMKIKSNILAPFLDEHNVKPDSLDVYFKSTRYIASTICDTFNHFVIPKLVDMNFARGGKPKLRVRRIGEWEDIRTMSFSFRNFVGAGAIRPDDELEKFLRQELDLPPVDEKTIRTVMTPQLEVGNGAQEALKGSSDDPNAQKPPGAPGQPTPPKVGAPRQSPSAPLGTGKSNTGKDGSGGK